MSLETIRVFAISKLDWIKRQQIKLQTQERESPREYLDRESHYVWGKRYLLKIVEADSAPGVELRHSEIVLTVRPRTNEDRKKAILDEWYRNQIKQAAPAIIAKLEPAMGVQVEHLFVQKMKTKWGSCNAEAQSIRLNSELAKKPRECLEYILAHEMVHLLVRNHDDRFSALMDRFMPNWKHVRRALNEAPLAHSSWVY